LLISEKPLNKEGVKGQGPKTREAKQKKKRKDKKGKGGRAQEGKDELDSGPEFRIRLDGGKRSRSRSDNGLIGKRGVLIKKTLGEGGLWER